MYLCNRWKSATKAIRPAFAPRSSTPAKNTRSRQGAQRPGKPVMKFRAEAGAWAWPRRARCWPTGYARDGRGEIAQLHRAAALEEEIKIMLRPRSQRREKLILEFARARARRGLALCRRGLPHVPRFRAAQMKIELLSMSESGVGYKRVIPLSRRAGLLADEVGERRASRAARSATEAQGACIPRRSLGVLPELRNGCED